MRSGGNEVLNFCANNYLGLADHPRRRRGCQEGVGRLGFRDGERAVHLRHADAARGAGAAAVAVPAHRGHDPVLVVLRRQRRPVRGAARRERRGDLRRAQPRLDHRRDPAVQGEALPLPQPRHGRSGGAVEGGGRRAAAADRHRRRLLDGRLLRAAGRHLRPGRAARRDGDGRRLACGRVRGRDRRGYAGARRRAGPRRHRVRNAGQGARRCVRRLHVGARRDRGVAAAAVAAVPVLQRGGAVGRGGFAGRAGPGGRQRANSAPRCAATPNCSGAG